jgi:hypothetical protein
MAKIRFGKELFSELHRFIGMEQSVFESKKARLFPLGNTTDENQTTSIFLASLQAVKEYREELLVNIGINKITNRNTKLHVYTEVYNENNTERIDGLVILTSGKNNPVIEWAAFIESKVKHNKIEQEQIERYIKFGRDIGINTIITISNEMTTSPYESPVITKKARNFNLYHWSWTYLKVMSTRLLRTNVIEDEDHVFILGELRRYFDTHKHILNFTHMGKQWSEASTSINEIPLGKKINKEVLNDIVNAYKQEEKDVSLQLTDTTPYYVQLLLKKNEEREESIAIQLQKDNRTITSTYFIDGDKKRTFDLEIDFLRKAIVGRTSVTVKGGKAIAQVSALLKKLKFAGVNEDIIISAVYKRNKRQECKLSQLLAEQSDNKIYSVHNKEYGDEIKFFDVYIKKEIGRDFYAPQKFIGEVEGLAQIFLLQVMSYVGK